MIYSHQRYPQCEQMGPEVITFTGTFTKRFQEQAVRK